MLPLGFVLGSQVIRVCQDPGQCTNNQVFVISEGGTLNSAGFLLIAGSVLLVVGIVLFVWFELKQKREIR